MINLQRTEIKTNLERKFQDLIAIIQENNIRYVMDELNNLRIMAEKYNFKDLMDSIDRKLRSCRSRKVKFFLLNSIENFPSLCIREICEKTEVYDEELISLVIFKLIKKRLIDAEYFSSTKSIIRELSAQKDRIFYVYKKLS